jgi:hypothetical protein
VIHNFKHKCCASLIKKLLDSISTGSQRSLKKADLFRLYLVNWLLEVAQKARFGSNITNAIGYSTIWGNSFPSNPYVSQKTKRGPAWANPLFRDSAEYSFGMFNEMKHRMQRLIKLVENCVPEAEITDDFQRSKEEIELLSHLHEWL